MAQDGALPRVPRLILMLLGALMGLGLLLTATARTPYSEQEEIDARSMGHLRVQNEEFRRHHSEAEVRIMGHG